MAGRAWLLVTLLLGGCPLGVTALSVDYPCGSDLDCFAPARCVDGLCAATGAVLDDGGAPVTDAGALDDGGNLSEDGGPLVLDDGGPEPERDAGLPEPDAGPAPCSGVADEDGDGIVDECDVCPARSDPAQDDRDGDGVGDACDPRPDVPGERILLFDGFSGDALDPAYVSAGGGSWSLDDGALVQASETVDARLWHPALDASDVIVETSVRFTTLAPFFRATAGPMGRIDQERAVACGFGKTAHVVIGGPPLGALDLYVLEWLTGDVYDADVRDAEARPSGEVARRLALDARGQNLRCEMVDDVTDNVISAVTSGAAGLRSSRARAVFEYLLVIASE